MYSYHPEVRQERIPALSTRFIVFFSSGNTFLHFVPFFRTPEKNRCEVVLFVVTLRSCKIPNICINLAHLLNSVNDCLLIVSCRRVAELYWQLKMLSLSR